MGPEESQGYSEFWIYQGSEYASCYERKRVLICVTNMPK